jgi:glutamate 5-kinase
MSECDTRQALTAAKRIVVKVGSSTLTHNGALRVRKFGDLARQIAGLFDDGKQVVLVSSGAIAIGSRELGRELPGQSIPQMQAAAAIGQIGLLQLYRRRFREHGRKIGQVLLTRVGLMDRERYLNARHTLHELLELGVVPIVNENDTVATEEIRFGDNDNLSATLVNLIGADLLVILTDVDGLYSEKPVPGRRKPKLVKRVEKITPEIKQSARGSDNAFGRGGMITKLEAADTAGRSGAPTVLCNGSEKDVIRRVAAGEDLGTLILPGVRMSSRKHWLAFTNQTRGSLVLDDGAVRALTNGGRSLLPAGVTAVEGEFRIGDAVACLGVDGREIARGLSAYTSAEATLIKGLPTQEIGRVLGYSNGDELIHRDDLVLLEE